MVRPGERDVSTLDKALRMAEMMTLNALVGERGRMRDIYKRLFRKQENNKMLSCDF
jgi:hypothetical protein